MAMLDSVEGSDVWVSVVSKVEFVVLLLDSMVFDVMGSLGASVLVGVSGLGNMINVSMISTTSIMSLILPLTYLLRKFCHFSMGNINKIAIIDVRVAKLGMLPIASNAKKITATHSPILFADFIVHNSFL